LLFSNFRFNFILLLFYFYSCCYFRFNFCYTDDQVTNRAPTHISQNVAAGGGAHFVRPAHTTHFSNTFAGSSSSSRQHTIDDVLFEMRTQSPIIQERDGLFYAMHQQQEEMLEQM
jgi:hypothetical protein